MSYEISSIKTPSPKDIDMLMSDSKHNESTLLNFKSLLHFDHIQDVSILRLTDTLSFYYAGTNKPKEILAYLKLKAWQDDQLFNSYQVYRFRVIDYLDEKYSDNTQQFSSEINHTLTLQIDRRHHDYKDSFMFDVARKHYQALGFEQRVHLIERLTSIINLYYSMIHVHTLLKLPKEALAQVPQEKDILEQQIQSHKEIWAHFNLTQNNVAYLRHIASGCTAKEIAQHMGKSYRSVQDAIKLLSEKFNVASKSQLEQVARVIVSQI